MTKLDRLARSVRDAKDIVDELTRREVKLSIGGSVDDPTDPVGRLLFKSGRRAPATPYVRILTCRDEYRANQLRKLRGSPKPGGSGNVDINLLEMGPEPPARHDISRKDGL